MNQSTSGTAGGWRLAAGVQSTRRTRVWRPDEQALSGDPPLRRYVSPSESPAAGRQPPGGASPASPARAGAALLARLRRLVHQRTGIHLTPEKDVLVTSRLMKRLRALGLSSFKEYLSLIERDRAGGEIASMIDALTTNKTSFFRESRHFDCLRALVLPSLRQRKRIRIWSAGCSTGEEPLSLAMVLREGIPDVDRRDLRILATDISRQVLERARQGIYDVAQLQAVPALLRERYFTCMPSRLYRAQDSVLRLVSWARLNLVDDWPMQGPFDVIFCRNVMIYFDRPTQERLVERFARMLRPGGYLFVGLSESSSAASGGLDYVEPAVYLRQARP